MRNKSGLFRLNYRQLLKGLILSVVGAVIQGVSLGLSGGTFDLKKVAIVGGVAGLSYLGTSLTQNNKGEYLKKDSQ